jgi:very-short-patch-repair endonuclease
MSHARPDLPAPPPPVIQGAAIDARKLARARSFRRQPTPAEATAWSLLRGRRLLGLKFRRQQVIAGFIVDFYCASRRLALELDGAPHDHPDQAEHDVRRTQALQKRTIQVLRLRNDQLDEPTLLELLAPYVQRFSSPLAPVHDLPVEILDPRGRGGPGG